MFMEQGNYAQIEAYKVNFFQCKQCYLVHDRFSHLQLTKSVKVLNQTDIVTEQGTNQFYVLRF